MKKVCLIVGPQEKIGKTIKKIQEVLKRVDEIEHSKTLKNTNVNRDIFRAAITTLVEREDVIEILKDRKRYYKWIGDK